MQDQVLEYYPPLDAVLAHGLQSGDELVLVAEATYLGRQSMPVLPHLLEDARSVRRGRQRRLVSEALLELHAGDVGTA